MDISDIFLMHGKTDFMSKKATISAKRKGCISKVPPRD